MLEISYQRASRTLLSPTAVCLADGHGQSMKLIEQMRKAGWRIGSESLASELSQRLVTLAPGLNRMQSVSLRDATKVLVGNRDRMAKGVKQDCVGGLRTYAWKGEKANAEIVSRDSGQPVE